MTSEDKSAVVYAICITVLMLCIFAMATVMNVYGCP